VLKSGTRGSEKEEITYDPLGSLSRARVEVLGKLLIRRGDAARLESPCCSSSPGRHIFLAMENLSSL
jgi:hypothetical protein